MRERRSKKPLGKYSVGDPVILRYQGWSPTEWTCPVRAEIAETRRFEGDARDYYLLKILDVGQLDKTDRSALEGPDRNLYGWVAAKCLSPG